MNPALGLAAVYDKKSGDGMNCATIMDCIRLRIAFLPFSIVLRSRLCFFSLLFRGTRHTGQGSARLFLLVFSARSTTYRVSSSGEMSIGVETDCTLWASAITCTAMRGLCGIFSYSFSPFAHLLFCLVLWLLSFVV